MRRTLDRSNEHYQRAVKRLPLGVSSNFRAWGPELTIYAARATPGPTIAEAADGFPTVQQVRPYLDHITSCQAPSSFDFTNQSAPGPM